MGWADDITDAYSGLETSDLLDFPKWALERPQQGVFQGAKAGADAFGDAYRESGNLPLSVMKSAIPAAAGMYRGWAGQEPNVSGKDLTDESISGGVLDVVADPLAAIPGAQSQKAGTAIRTAGNLWDTRKYAPNAYERLRNLGFGNMLGLDVASAPRSAESLMPVTIRTAGSPAQLGQDLGYASRGGDKTAGWITPTKDIIAADATRETPSFGHEFLHWAKQFYPEETISPALESLAAWSPKVTERVKGIYGNIPYDRVGEEMLAAAANAGTPEILKGFTEANPYLRELKDLVSTAAAHVPSAVYEAAAPLNIPNPLHGLKALYNWLGGE